MTLRANTDAIRGATRPAGRGKVSMFRKLVALEQGDGLMCSRVVGQGIFGNRVTATRVPNDNRTEAT